jgi:hypothetical protein
MMEVIPDRYLFYFLFQLNGVWYLNHAIPNIFAIVTDVIELLYFNGIHYIKLLILYGMPFHVYDIIQGT